LNLPAQDADPGRLVFEGRCARCHGADGNGGELGPAIRGRLAVQDIDTAALTRALVEHGAILEYAPTVQSALVARFRGKWPPPAPKQ